MNIKGINELMEIIDNIRELNIIEKYFDRNKLEELLLKLQKKYLDKSLAFELSYLINQSCSFSSINNILDSDLKIKYHIIDHYALKI